jgi:hypothetical protein
MLLFLYRLFIVGFPKAPKCDHTWSAWTTLKIATSTYGHMKIFQQRSCKKCGFVQIDVETHN